MKMKELNRVPNFLIWLILFGIFGVCTNSRADISAAEYREVKAVIEEITEKFPPGRSVYIGVGQSPSLLMAALDSFTGVVVVNLPLTAFRYQIDMLNEVQKARLFRHFKYFLPKKDFLANKNLVLIDYAHEGETIISVTNFMKSFLDEERYLGVKLYGVAMMLVASEKQVLKNIQTQKMEGYITPIQLSNESILGKKMELQLYESASAYGSYDIIKEGYKVFDKKIVDDEYLDLVKEFRSFYVADQEQLEALSSFYQNKCLVTKNTIYK